MTEVWPMYRPHLSLPALVSLVLVAPWALSQPLDPLDIRGREPEARSVGEGAAPSGEPVLRANLIDMEAKARKGWATVQADALNVSIIDPAAAGEEPRPGQAHFHYQVDSGPVVATTASKLSFHELSPGSHMITVILAGNDHQPVAKPVVLSVRVH